jgi:FkbM family methyltransferase
MSRSRGANTARALYRAGKLAGILRRPGYRTGLRHGVAAAIEHEHVPLPFEPRTILDIGAHSGQFALVARNLYPSARLICFEPLAGPRQKLGRILADDGNSDIRAVALAEVDGEQEMQVSGKDDSSSLLGPTPRQAENFPGSQTVGRRRVPVQRLDTALADVRLDRPTLLKMDVQGAEQRVLEGGIGILEQTDAALIECSFVELYAGQALAAEIITWMSSHAFTLMGVYSPAYDSSGVCIQADLLFEATS